MRQCNPLNSGGIGVLRRLYRDDEDSSLALGMTVGRHGITVGRHGITVGRHGITVGRHGITGQG